MVSVSDQRAIARMLAWTSIPEVWRQLGPREWAKLGAAMIEATGDEDEARAQVRAAHPGWADQADAAADEAGQLARRPIAGISREDLIADPAAEAALRGQVLRVLAGLAGGSMAGCPHADVATPRPLYAAAWGTRVDCRDCFPRSPVQNPTPVESRTCDLCGRVQLRTVLLATPTVGMITLGLGVCSRCLARMRRVEVAPPGP
jgi:hypothetical protein